MADATTIANPVRPLEGRMAAGPNVQIRPAEPAHRLSLRARNKSVAALSKALGFALPQKPKMSASKGSRAALWLGPDEWLIIDTGANAPSDALKNSRVLQSAVDISMRNTAIIVSGAGAQAVLAAGCPQELHLEKFPTGACSRTMFGKAEVVIWRTAKQEFRIECWRSFSTYVFDFLEEAARDAGA